MVIFVWIGQRFAAFPANRSAGCRPRISMSSASSGCVTPVPPAQKRPVSGGQCWQSRPELSQNLRYIARICLTRAFLSSNPTSPASKCRLCSVISRCVRTADISAVYAGQLQSLAGNFQDFESGSASLRPESLLAVFQFPFRSTADRFDIDRDQFVKCRCGPCWSLSVTFLKRSPNRLDDRKSRSASKEHREVIRFKFPRNSEG
jgi:hypothetical protein